MGSSGDTYDRYLIRMLEMGESLAISNYIALKLYKLSSSTIEYTDYLGNFSTKERQVKNNSYTSMEELITHFMH
jgi:NADH:ubiquinone oxidoreductase subunit D